MLDSLVLDYCKNLNIDQTGIDSYANCLNKKHFLDYPYSVNYQYNSRGFRDEEWPHTDLENCVWCFGDSFTVGLGSPLEHTWVNLLQTKINKRCINISMDGASNQWISRRAVQVLKEIKPKNMIIMWSYFHRRERSNYKLNDAEKRLRFIKYETIENDIFHFKWNLNFVEKNKNDTNVIYLVIPNPVQQGTIYEANVDNFLGEVKLIDYARDYHHFDIQTSHDVVDSIIPLLAK